MIDRNRATKSVRIFRVVVAIFLVALKLNLKWCTLLQTFLPNVVEDWMRKALLCWVTEIRIETQESLQNVKDSVIFEILKLMVPNVGTLRGLHLGQDLLRVVEGRLVCEEREIDLLGMAELFKYLYILIVFTNACRPRIRCRELWTWWNWKAILSREKHALILISPNPIHLIWEGYELSQDAANAPQIGPVSVVLLHNYQFRCAVPAGCHMWR